MKKRILALITVLSLVLTFFPATVFGSGATSGSCGDNVTWEFDTVSFNEALIISGSGPMDNYSYPNESPWALDYSRQIYTLKVARDVTSIGSYAFAAHKNLHEVYLPITIETIEENAFNASPRITDVYYAGTERGWSYVSISAGNQTLENATIHFTGYSPSPAEEADFLLQLNSMSNFAEALNLLTNDGEYFGFDMARFDNLPEAMKRRVIQQMLASKPYSTVSEAIIMFDRCMAEAEFQVPSGGNPSGGGSGGISRVCGDNLAWTYENGALTITGTGDMYYYENDCDVPWYSYRESITSVSLPEGITAIGKNAFKFCSALEDIVIPDSVTDLGDYSFDMCSGLKNITLGANITYIGENVFYGCDATENLYISDLTAYINIERINFDSGHIAPNLYLNNELVTDLVIPDDVEILGNDVFGSFECLETVTIHNRVTEIGERAFAHCHNLRHSFFLGSDYEWSNVYIGFENDHLLNTLTTTNESAERRVLDLIATANIPQMKEILHQYHSLLGIDLLLFEKSAYKMDILRELCGKQYASVADFCCIYKDIIAMFDKVSGPTQSGGSSGGGGGFGPFDMHIRTLDDHKFEEEPEPGTQIKLDIRATYMLDEAAVYVAAVYDKDDRLVDTVVHPTSATQLYEPEFFGLITEYGIGSYVKIYTWKDMKTMVPLESEVTTLYFDYGYEMPVAEEEKDGIIAVRGQIINESATEMELLVFEKRAFGYWVPSEQEEVITVKCDADMQLAYFMAGNIDPESYFCLAENENGEYTVDSFECRGEIISFFADDISACYTDRIVISDVEYPYSQYMSLPVWQMTKDMYYAYVEDGEIIECCGYCTYSDKVIAVSNDSICLDRMGLVDKAFVTANLSVGDIVIVSDGIEVSGQFRQPVVRKAEKVSAKFYSDYIIADGKKYDNIIYDYRETFAEGEDCFAYFGPDRRAVYYIGKDYGSKELVIVTGGDMNENGEYFFITNKGEISLQSEVYFQDMRMNTELFFNNYFYNFLPCPMYLTDAEDVTVIDEAHLVADIHERYMEDTNTIGGYFIPADNVYEITSDGVNEDVTLINNLGYTVRMFTFEVPGNMNIDCVLISGAETTAITKNILVTDMPDSHSINGYIDGELTEMQISPSCDWNLNSWALDDISCGLMLKVGIKNDMIVSVEHIINPGERIMLNRSNMMNFPVCDVKDNVLILIDDTGTRRAIVTDSETDVYIVNLYDMTIELGDVGDIRYGMHYDNPAYGVDWALLSINPGTKQAESIVIYR